MRHLAWISVSILFLGLSLAASAADDEAGFTPIFNGKDLTGWDGAPGLWSVKDGVIVGETTEQNKLSTNTFLIWRGGQADNFVLRLSIKLRNHNTGIQYRSHEIDGVKWGMGGYQADFASDDWIPGICYEERGRGVLARQGQKVQIKPDGKIEVLAQFASEEDVRKAIKIGEWNDYEIVAQGNHLIQKINGQVTCDIVDDQLEKRAMAGQIGFQMHVGPPMEVEFKNVRLKALEKQ
jgi:hypothetical protein